MVVHTRTVRRRTPTGGPLAGTGSGSRSRPTRPAGGTRSRLGVARSDQVESEGGAAA